MIKEQYIQLNMIPNGIMPILSMSQYDIGRTFGLVVYNGSESVDLDDYAVTVEGTRTDGTAITVAVSTDDNIGVFVTTATMTNKADKYIMQCVLCDGDGDRVASIPFVMRVIESAMDENSMTIAEDKSLYQQYTAAVQSQIAEIKADLNAETSARENADTSLSNALSAETTARTNADTTLQSNINAEATARQTDVDGLHSAINAEASARASADTFLQSEIDQMIAPSGGAPSAAEVQNARIGADGVTYSTLGDAIRANDNALGDRISNVGTYTIQLESGSFSDSDGITKTSRNDRIRCSAPIPVKGFFRLAPPSGYELYTFELDRDLNLAYTRTWTTNTMSRYQLHADTEWITIVFRLASDTSANISGNVNTVEAGMLYMSMFDETVTMKTVLYNTDDMNSIVEPGMYYYGPTNVPTHAPTSYASVVVVYGFGAATNARVQEVYAYTVDHTSKHRRYLKSNGSWSSWEQCAFSTSGDYADLDAAMGEIVPYLSDIRRGGTLTSSDDLDDIVAHGMYYYNASSKPANAPFGYNTLIQVFGGTSTTSSLMQRAYSYTSGNEGSAIRYLYLGVWSSWVYDYSSGNDDVFVSGAAVNVRYPLNATYSSANPNPYTYHQKVVTLAHFSDIHGHAAGFQAFMDWANQYTSFYDDILCTGDIVEWYDETSGSGTDDYMDFWKAIPNANKILITIGNHDAKDEQVSAQPGWLRKSIARSRELYMYGINSWGVQSPANTTWWYKDYANSNLRLIGLDTTVVAGSTEDAAQLSWFESVLSNAKTNNKAVVVAEHYQPTSGVTVPSDFTAENRAIWSSSYFQMSDDYHDAVQTFINGGGEFVCWLAGHTHTDFVAYNSNYPDQMFFIVTSLWNDLRTSDQARTNGTSSFIAANLIGFDTERKLIKIARIGANYDFNLRPRNILVYNYQTKTIVRQSSGD